MSAAAPLAVPPASIDGTPLPSVTIPPSAQPNATAPPPPALSAPPPIIQTPPPPVAVIAAPPPATPPLTPQLPPPSIPATPPSTSQSPPPIAATPPSAPQLPPPSIATPPPLKPPSSPPPPTPTSEVVSPPHYTSPPPPTPNPPSDPLESSPPPPFISSPSPTTPPHLSPPPPAPTPTKSSLTPPFTTPFTKSPPPPKSKQPRASPPSPETSPLSTYPPPPLGHITPNKSLTSSGSTPPSQPSPSPANSSTNSPAPPLVISPPSNFAPGTPEKLNSTQSGSSNAAVAAVIGVGFGILALSLLTLIIWCVFKRRKKASINGRYIVPSPCGSSIKSDFEMKINSLAPLIQSASGSESAYSMRKPGLIGHSRSWFAYEELVVATNGFSPKNLLGEGGFGFVYKGYLPDGRVIAVKQLKIGSGQGEREFKAEVEIISRIHHRHLVSLVGYCVADSRRLLVYEYVPNNTLYFHLHGDGRPPMIWATRVQVAAGAARGLAYLHEDCNPRIIHRDIKSSNILLSNNFDALVSDFGLAKLALDTNSHITTRVMGTFGYMAPEYVSSGKLTEKSDVYSFGVVLLELITGRKPVDVSQPSGDESLVEWARPLLSHAIETAEFGSLVDPRLENNYVQIEMFRMIEAAAACVRHSAAKRPRMGQIVRAFDSILSSDVTNGMQLGQSQVFDSAEESAEISLFRKMAFGSQNYSTDFLTHNIKVNDDSRRLENESTLSDLHDETTYILELDLDSHNQFTKQVSHIGS